MYTTSRRLWIVGVEKSVRDSIGYKFWLIVTLAWLLGGGAWEASTAFGAGPDQTTDPQQSEVASSEDTESDSSDSSHSIVTTTSGDTKNSGASGASGASNELAFAFHGSQPPPLEKELLESAQLRAHLASASGNQEAKDALEQLRVDQDSFPLLRFLVNERGQRSDDRLHRDREIAHLATVHWQIQLARSAVERILQQAPDDPDALIRKGHLDLLRGSLNDAMVAYQRVLAIAEAADIDSWRGTAYGNIGLIHQKLGDLNNAEQMYRRALEVFEAVDQPRGKSSAYDNLGLIYRAKGDLDRAELMTYKALEISETHDLKDSMAAQLSHLGLILQTRGDLDEAEKFQTQALAIFEQLKELQGVAQVASNLGLIYLARDQLEQAEMAFRQAIRMNEKLGRVEGVAKAQANLGLVYQSRGQLDEAERLFREALDIEEKLGRSLGIANQHGNLGMVYCQRGDFKHARDSWEVSRRLFNQIGMPHMAQKVEGLLQSLPDATPPITNPTSSVQVDITP